MRKQLIKATLLSISFIASCAAYGEAKDARLIGEWYGQRDSNAKCSFLSWRTNRNPDGTFAITFFFDKERTKEIQTEMGTWLAAAGKFELKTNNVPTTETYTYKFIGHDRVKFVNINADPSADCQEDYEFIEQRAPKQSIEHPQQ